jgi:serine/threonine protein kinase
MDERTIGFDEALLPAAVSLEAGAVFDGRYRIISLAGQGGMGTVYEAQDQQMGRRVALKVMHTWYGNDQLLLSRFKQEAKAASSLNDANVVHVYNSAVAEGGEPYLVMEFVHGQTLARLLQDKGALDQQRAIGIFMQICSGLQHAHEIGLVHRDLKPGNVMLVENADGTEIAKLVDFGVSKFIDNRMPSQAVTTTGRFVGSPVYMSPEQCTAGKIDARSDIYSFGCMMYECLTGKIPFPGATPFEIMGKHANEQASSFSTLNLKLRVSPELEAIVLKALSKKADARFQTAQELLVALQNCDLSKVCGRRISKHSVYDFARVATIVCLAAIFVGGGYQIWQSSNSRAHERAESLVDQAQRDVQLGRFPDAEKKAKEAIELNPKNHRAYLLHGQAFSSLHLFNPEVAIQDLTTAIELAPQADPVYYYCRSFIYERTRRNKESLADGETAERLWKEGKQSDLLLAVPEMYSVRAAAKGKLGDLEGAMADVDKAIDRKLGAGLFYVLKGRILQKFGKWEESLKPLRRGSEIHSAATEGHFAIARSLVHLGEYQEALRKAEVAVQMQMKPELQHTQNWRDVTGESYYVAGMVYDKLGRANDAKKAFESAASYGITKESDLDEGW